MLMRSLFLPGQAKPALPALFRRSAIPLQPLTNWNLTMLSSSSSRFMSSHHKVHLARDVLPFKEGRFESVIVHTAQVEDSAEDFAARLRHSVSQWRQQNKKSVWLHVPIEKSNYIAPSAELKFEFHHSEPRFSMLCLWLPESSSKIPHYATHQVGVGGFVLNPKNQVLVVKDRYTPVRGWKLPGGLSELGEDFGTTAEREVFEETGVRSKFESFLAFRNHHGVAHGRSDIYAIVRLRALSEEIKLDPQELEDAQWMSIEQYMKEAPSELNRKVAALVLHSVKNKLPPGSPLGAELVEEEMASVIDKSKTFKFYFHPLPHSTNSDK